MGCDFNTWFFLKPWQPRGGISEQVRNSKFRQDQQDELDYNECEYPGFCLNHKKKKAIHCHFYNIFGFLMIFQNKI